MNKQPYNFDDELDGSDVYWRDWVDAHPMKVLWWNRLRWWWANRKRR